MSSLPFGHAAAAMSPIPSTVTQVLRGPGRPKKICSIFSSMKDTGDIKWNKEDDGGDDEGDFGGDDGGDDEVRKISLHPSGRQNYV